MPLIEHRVVFSPSRGIFLGLNENNKVIWSKDKGLSKEEKAPVFDDQREVEKYIQNFLTPEEQEVWPQDIILVTVYPQETNPVVVDMETVANAGLPVWAEESRVIK